MRRRKMVVRVGVCGVGVKGLVGFYSIITWCLGLLIPSILICLLELV